MNDEIRQSVEAVEQRLYSGEPRPCPYLPGRTAEDVYTLRFSIQPALYQGLMDVGYRRSGRVIYRPVCGGCRECVPLRVPVSGFRASRSQRRVWRRNHDVAVTIDEPRISQEKWEIYASYQRSQHEPPLCDDWEGLRQFLYSSPTDTLEMEYRIAGRLAGVGIVDACPDCLSSVYFFFDPEFGRRGLGTYSILREIEECRLRGLGYWYAGFLVRDCRKMAYKAAFRPYELLGSDGLWRTPPDFPASGADLIR